jgi:hypothetical protein
MREVMKWKYRRRRLQKRNKEKKYRRIRLQERSNEQEVQKKATAEKCFYREKITAEK